MKILLQDECAKCNSNIAVLQTKTSKQFVEVIEHLNAERTARERASAASRSDLMQKCGEMKSLVETKAYDLAKDQKNSVSRLAFLIDTVRQDLEKTTTQRDKMIEASEK